MGEKRKRVRERRIERYIDRERGRGWGERKKERNLRSVCV